MQKIINFGTQLSNYSQTINCINDESNKLCDFCNNIAFSYSVTFYDPILDKKEEMCMLCMKNHFSYLYQTINRYIKYMKFLLGNGGLYRTPPNPIVNMIKTGLLLDEYTNDIISLVCDLSREYKLLSQYRSHIMFEDLLNINIKLLQFYTFKNKNIEDKQFNINICLCGRYYDPIYEINYQCSQCYNHYNNNDYYCIEIQKMLQINKNYAIDKLINLCNFTNVEKNTECYICQNDNLSKVFHFECKHSICQCCYTGIIDTNNDSCYIGCPFCRHKQPIIIDNMCTWKDYYIFIKHDLQMAIINDKCISMSLIEKCKARSNYIIREMMKKKNLKVYNYLEKLEKMGLLGWCNHFPDGLLSNQNI